MNTTFDDNHLDRLLETAAARDNQQWSDEPAPPSLPADCPTLPRMYQAIVRDDWTNAELAAIEKTPKAQMLLAKVDKSVWYPTKMQLFKHSVGLLKGDELEDVKYHLEVDQCKRSLRWFHWMTVPQGFTALVKKPLQWGADALDSIDAILSNTFGTQQTLQPIPVLMGAATAAPSSQEALFENDKLSVSLSREKGYALSDCLTVKSREHKDATLMRLILVDNDGFPVESRFIVLRPGFEATVGKLTLKSPVPVNCSIYCLVMAASDLGDRDAEQLRADYAAVQTDDPSGIDSWKKWATSVREQRNLEIGIRPAIEDIAYPARGH